MTKSNKSLNFLTSFYYLLSVRFSKFQKLLLRRQTVGNFTKDLTDRYVKFINENETFGIGSNFLKIPPEDNQNSHKEEDNRRNMKQFLSPNPLNSLKSSFKKFENETFEIIKKFTNI